MAQIPDYGGFHTTPGTAAYSPASTTFVKTPTAAMPDLSGTFARLDKIAAQELEKNDQSRATAAMTELRRYAIDRQNGEGGYATLLGENALTKDEKGRGLVEREDVAFTQKVEELAQGLDTPRQQQLFREKAAALQSTAYGAVSSHVFQQGIKARDDTAVAAVDMAKEEFTLNPYDRKACEEQRKSIVENMRTLGELRGWADDRVRYETKKQTSAAVMGAVAKALENADVNPQAAYAALGILRANKSYVLGTDAAKAMVTINGYIEKAEDNAIVDRWGRLVGQGAGTESPVVGMAAAAATDGTISKEALQSGGARLLDAVIGAGGNMQSNTEIPKDAEGKALSATEWRWGIGKLDTLGIQEAFAENSRGLKDSEFFAQIKSDKRFALAVSLDHMNACYARAAGDNTTALAYYYGGREAVEKAQADAGKDGNWLEKLKPSVREKVAAALKAYDAARQAGPKNADGSAANSSFDPGVIAASWKGMTDEEIYNLVVANDPKSKMNPATALRRTQLLKGYREMAKASYVQKRENMAAQVNDLLYANGGDLRSIPTDLWAQMTYADQQSAVKLADQINRGEDITDPQIAGRYASDEALGALSLDGLKSLRGFFSRQDYQVLCTRYYAVKGKLSDDADKRAEELRQLGLGQIPAAYADIAHGTVKESLKTYIDGFGKLDPETQDMLIASASSAVARELARRGMDAKNLKGNVAMDQLVPSVIRDQMVRRPIMFTFGLLGDTKSIYSYKVTELPNRGYTDCQNVLKEIALRTYGHQPSDRELQRVYFDLMTMKRPNLIFGTEETLGVKFDKKIMEDVDARFEKIAPGYRPTTAERVRAYIIHRISGASITSTSPIRTPYVGTELN